MGFFKSLKNHLSGHNTLDDEHIFILFEKRVARLRALMAKIEKEAKADHFEAAKKDFQRIQILIDHTLSRRTIMHLLLEEETATNKMQDSEHKARLMQVENEVKLLLTGFVRKLQQIIDACSTLIAAPSKCGDKTKTTLNAQIKELELLAEKIRARAHLETEEYELAEREVDIVAATPAGLPNNFEEVVRIVRDSIGKTLAMAISGKYRFTQEDMVVRDTMGFKDEIRKKAVGTYLQHIIDGCNTWPNNKINLGCYKNEEILLLNLHNNLNLKDIVENGPDSPVAVLVYDTLSNVTDTSGRRGNMWWEFLTTPDLAKSLFNYFTKNPEAARPFFHNFFEQKLFQPAGNKMRILTYRDGILFSIHVSRIGKITTQKISYNKNAGNNYSDPWGKKD
ncbi:hypothetical protein COV16_06135 [Candidatus Woesearchaeota archaeon CG10_big_fil_rev_8_21_14_0_10_34_8]|nr:MAG: hypothetical protein COV16_06135 [Candidatus Woesearchaeota archaeon CG10_big_fil_rev_8_21_14_0_10_34_8]